MSKFINPFTDWGFKQIFGQEVSKELLIEFLNDLLEGERVIRELRFLNNEQLPNYQEGKGIIYDIYCTTDTGEHIIVEMQGSAQVHFRERALYYLSRAIVSQGVQDDKGRYGIKAVYGVFFMNFEFRENPKMRIDVILADRDNGELFSDKLRQIYITLPLFNKEENECDSDFERWIYVLKNMKTLERMPFKARKAVFEKLEEIADVSALSPEERAKYDQSLKVYNDYVATMEAAEQNGIERGMEQGIEQGIQQGVEQGIKQGVQQGIEQGIEQGVRQTAREMKLRGIDRELISQITKIPIEDIEKL